MAPIEIDRPTRARIAATAHCDERTVHKYLQGKRTAEIYVIAIRKAAAELGITLPAVA